MTNRTIIIVLLILITNNLFSQVSIDDRELAQVGYKSIYKSEFQKRLEFAPQYGRTPTDPDSVFKYELLYTLIAEKLLAIKAEQLSLDTTVFVRTPVRYIEKMLVRDALYKVEVLGNAQIDSLNYHIGIARYLKTINARYFIYDTKAEADSVNKLILSYSSVDELIESNSELKNSLYNITIKFGEFPQEIENRLFSLNENEHTEPFEMNNKWYLFFIDKIISNNPSGPKEWIEAEKKVTSVLKRRNSESAYDNFYKKFFTDKKIRANSNLYKSFVGKLKKQIENSGISDSIIHFTNKDALWMEESFGTDSLDLVFIESDNNKVLLKEFIREFTFEGFNYSRNDSLTIEERLSARLKKYMQQHLLVFEGFKRGFQYLPDVINNLRMWRDYYLALAIKENIFHSVEIPVSSQFHNSEINLEKNTSLNDLKSTLRETAGYQNLLKETQKLADSYKIHVDKDLFKSIESSYINLFVFRYFGFGGQLPAVPMTVPFTEWFKLWDSKKTISF